MVNSDQNRRHLSKATGDILKAVLAIQHISPASESVPPSEIAARTGTSRAFVTKMLKAMKDEGLVEYAPYRGVSLSPAGKRAAIELSRHHRLLECFLANTLGFSLDDAHAEAERLEHVISEQFEAKLASFLGHPKTCPHGMPIPNLDGTYPETNLPEGSPK